LEKGNKNIFKNFMHCILHQLHIHVHVEYLCLDYEKYSIKFITNCSNVLSEL